MHKGASIDDDCLSRNEVAFTAGEEHHRPHEILRRLHAPKRS